MWSPKAAETMPKGYTVKPKLMDRWSSPRRIAAMGTKVDHYIILDQNNIPQDVRADSMTPYCFFTDGKPSVQERRKFTAAERRALNKDPETYLPPIIRVNDMAAFPLTVKTAQAFGIGLVKSIDIKQQTFDLHWYSNDIEDIHGAFKPVWIRDDDSWYCDDAREHPSHRPMMTSECYPAPITQSCIGDTGFCLLDDGRLPFTVLQNISDNKKFKWKLPTEFTENQQTDIVAVR